MTKRFFILILTVVTVFAIPFAARQRTLTALRSGNETLRKQLQAKPPLAMADPNLVSVPKLNDAEERELLQLRSKITSLRAECHDASNMVNVLQNRLAQYVKH